MAQTNPVYDTEETGRRRSARDRANKSWGMEPNREDPDIESGDIDSSQDPRSAQSRANEHWGLADKEANASPEDGQDGARSSKEPALTSESDTSKANDKSDDTVGKGWTGRNRQKAKGFVEKRKKAVIATITATVVGGAIIGIVALPRLAVNSMVTKTTEYFYSRVEQVVDNRLEKVFNGYAKQVILPSINNCGTTISRDCDIFDPGKGRVANVYKAWRNNGLEEKLLQNHGLEFKKSKFSNNLEVFRVDALGNRTTLGDFGQRSASKQVLAAINTETRGDDIIKRRHVRGLLSSKYGVARYCTIACETRDNLSDLRIDAKQKLKLRIALRILGPVDKKTNAYLLCFISGCDGGKLDNIAKEAGQQLLGESEEVLIREAAADIDNRKLSQFMTKKFVDKFFGKFLGKEAGEKAASAIPVVGQVYLAVSIAEIASTIDDAIVDKSISKWSTEMNSTAAAENFTAITSLNDDLISGKASVEDSGAAFSLVSGFNQSRVWQSINGSTDPGGVVCEDGSVLDGPDADLVCPEKAIRQDFVLEEWRENGAVDFGVDAILGTYKAGPRLVVKPILNGIDFVLGAVSETALSALEKVPGLGQVIGSIQGKVEEYAPRFIEWAGTKVFNRSFNPDAENAEFYDQYAAGADVTSNEFLKGSTDGQNTQGLGASAITPVQEAALYDAYLEEKRLDTQGQSVFARYFDIGNPDSLATTVAIQTIPSSSVPDTASTIASVGFPNIFSGLATVFSGKASAISEPGVASRQNMFGVIQYGFALDDASLATDPTELTDEDCASFAQIREETSYEDPETKEIIYTKSNPCMVDDVILDAFTKKFDLDSEQSSTTGSFIDLTTFLTDKRQDTSNVPCAVGTTSERVVTVANGSEIRLCSFGSTAEVNSAWSPAVKQLLDAASADGINLSSGGFRTAQEQIRLRTVNGCADVFNASPKSCNIPTARPGTSNHEFGLALDVRSLTSSGGARCVSLAVCPGNPTYDWLVANAGQFGIKKLSSERWHWSIDGR